MTQTPDTSIDMTTHDAAGPHGQTHTHRAIVITGAGGEVGHGLMGALAEQGRNSVVAIDLNELNGAQRALASASLVADVCDRDALRRLLSPYQINEIHHLAALLSTSAERNPEKAHAVNVGGTMNMLHLALRQAHATGQAVKFVYPSSIAAYGLPDVETKNAVDPVHEEQYNQPRTIYGCNKLYGESVGRYYSRYYRQLDADANGSPIDFRCVRFPGLISAETVPTGGTSDFAPEMIHAAAQGKPYTCFVREDTRIPFMTMPDAIRAMLQLADADRTRLSRCVYNVAAFSASAGELAALTQRYFPGAKVTFKPDAARQAIVDAWPADVNTEAARQQWGFSPEHDLETAFRDYLVPGIQARYT